MRLGFRIRSNGSFGSGGGIHGGGRRVGSSSGVRLFLDAHQTLIGNFPAEVAVLATLLEILFEEDGTAGIRDENSGRRQKNVAGAILHFHTTPEIG